MTDLQAECDRISADNDGAPVVIIVAQRGHATAHWSEPLQDAEAAALMLAGASETANASIRSMGGRFN